MAKRKIEYVLAEPLGEEWWTDIGIDMDSVDTVAAEERLRANLQEEYPDAEIIIEPECEWGSISAARCFTAPNMGEVEYITERCDQNDPLFWIYYDAASSVNPPEDEDAA